MNNARNALLASIAMASVSVAHAQVSAQIGTLACDVSRGIGMIVMQKQTLTCTFRRDAGGPAETYIGSLDEYGVAIGDVASGHLVWGVIAAEGRASRRAGRNPIAELAPTRRSSWEPARMCWLVAPSAPSRCSPFPCRARWA